MQSSVRKAVPSPSPLWLVPDHNSSFCDLGLQHRHSVTALPSPENVGVLTSTIRAHLSALITD